MSDYIARRYAKMIAEQAIENAAQDQAYESVAEMAEDDALELSADALEELQEKVYRLLSDSTNVVIG